MDSIFIGRKIISIAACFLLLFVFTFHAGLCQAEETFRLKTVVIDAGHGGKDPGAVGKNGYEKDIVLPIALKLGKYIEDNFDDIKVIYTRKTDDFVELFRRAEIANQNKADLFISIHANSNPNIRAYGAETYAMGLHTNSKNLAVAMKENAVITYEDDYNMTYEGYDPNSPESFIIFNFLQNTHLEQSLRFAAHVQDQFRERANRVDRGVKQAGFIVLWRTTMPSVLIETGYISNTTEEKYLLSSSGQDYLASAIFRAFREYKTELENQAITASAQAQTNQRESIRFKVQVTTSSSTIPIDSKMFDGFSDVEEFNVNGIYKYAVGNSKDYNEIITYSKEVRKKFRDAFVIAVKNDIIIPLSNALKELNIN
jgi:N-acetylmuramoyl-L-alanine amidase